MKLEFSISVQLEMTFLGWWGRIFQFGIQKVKGYGQNFPVWVSKVKFLDEFGLCDGGTACPEQGISCSELLAL